MKITIILCLIIIIQPLSLYTQTAQPIPPLVMLEVIYVIKDTYGPSCNPVTLEMIPSPVEILQNDRYYFNPGTTVYLQGKRYPAQPRCGTAYAELHSISGTDVVYNPGGSPDGDYYIYMDSEKQITVSYYCIESTLCPTEPPSTPTPTPSTHEEGIWFDPVELTVLGNESFDIEVHMNSGEQTVALYTMDVSYEHAYVTLDTGKGTNGVSPGTEGFVTAVSQVNPGTFVITGFDATGKGPGTDLHFLTLHWAAGFTPGTAVIVLQIPELYNTQNEVINIQNQVAVAIISISNTVLGDVDLNGSVDIIDALLIAQFYVELDPMPFNPAPADVNCDGYIDIVDALRVAQFYVGLITGFTCPH